MPKYKSVVIIPARLKSSRLPEKVILDLAGKPVIERVYDQALKAKMPERVFIATDSEKVMGICNGFTQDVVMTSDDHISGTDRIAEAAKEIDTDVIINVQGDEPFIQPSIIDELISQFEDEELQMASVMCKITTREEYLNPNAVKVVTDRNNYALYFSRASIPYSRDEMERLPEVLPKEMKVYKHLGIYAYRKSFISKYSSLKPTYLETTEKLEQLRVLENGYKIKMIESLSASLGIDTLEDLEKAQDIFKSKNN